MTIPAVDPVTTTAVAVQPEVGASNGHPDTVAAQANTDPGAAPDEVWGHEVIEDFYGDRLEVRKPTEQALAAYSLAMSRYVPQQTRNDITGMFINKHMSDETFAQVWGRLMNPDETDYGVETIGELMRKIVALRYPDAGLDNT
jgi:hypothetical protein